MDIFAALAVPTRRTIIEMLAKRGRMPAGDIARKFNASPPAISQHLKVLRKAKLVKVEKRGRARIYGVDVRAVAALDDWAKQVLWEWNERFDRLEKVLQAEKRKNKTKKHEK